MTGAALNPFAALGRRANDVNDEAGAGVRPARATGEAADGIDLAFAGLSQMHRMIDGGDRGDPSASLHAAKVELLRRIGSWRDGARAVPSWLRGVGIALTARGSAIRVNVHPVTLQDEREIAQIPRAVRPPGVGTHTPVLVERVGDIAAQGDEAGEALDDVVHLGLGVGESALAKTSGAGAAVAASAQAGLSGGSVHGHGGPMRRAVMGREASWDTGALNIDMAAVGGMATQAGGKLSAMSRGSRSTGSQVLGTAGEGLRNAGMGAGIGASIGSVIPGIGTVIGGAIGAIGGAISGVVHHLLSGPHRHRRKLTPQERTMLNRGLRISRTRHRPGAFQDAVLYVYTPAVYRSLSALKRLPSQIEARLLQQRTYAAHAAAVDRAYGVRLRRELAHLPPELRTLVGVGSVTGHARELYIALHRALAERARLAHHGAIRPRHAAPVFAAPPPEAPEGPELLEPTATPEPEDAQESVEDPFRELPLARDADEDDADAGGPLDEIALTLEQARRAQRRYLRDSWVNNTWLGDVLHLDQPDDPSAPVAPALSPGSGRPPTITLVPEPDTGAPPTNAEEAHAQVLANRPTLPPTAWAPLQAPVQVYFWEPFVSQWKRVGDTDGNDRAKGLVLLLVVSAQFPLAYCLLHTARGTEVIRAVKNPSMEPTGDDRFGVWRPVSGGVSRFWTPLFTFYARRFEPGEPVRFDFGWGVKPDTGDPFDDAAGTATGAIFDDVYGKRLSPESSDTGALGRTYAAEGGETPQAIAKRYDALARERWATELKAANPQRDWTARIYAGDAVAIPDAWPQPFWGAAKERGLLEASGPSLADTGAPLRSYAAEEGETPQTIAKRYDALSRTRWAAELKAANPQRDWTARIYPGDVIRVPEAWPQPFWGTAKDRGFLEASGPSAAETGALTRTYAAAGGETPQAIARRYDALTRERWATELRAANPQRDWTARIYAGDVIAVPEAWPQPFWGAAKERGLLDASGPRGAPALATADPFRELRAQRGRLS